MRAMPDSSPTDIPTVSTALQEAILGERTGPSLEATSLAWLLTVFLPAAHNSPLLAGTHEVTLIQFSP